MFEPNGTTLWERGMLLGQSYWYGGLWYEITPLMYTKDKMISFKKNV